MEKGSGDGGLKLQVGQLAEMKAFEDGFRGAWFRCKINDVDLKENKIKLEYYDFDEGHYVAHLENLLLFKA
ncbi:agenet domain-containing protein [Tanacetum coccineum]